MTRVPGFSAPIDPMTPVELVAPAKLTLGLRIVGVRDDGYHLIDAEMVSLDLADHLTLRPGTGIRLTGEGRSDMSSVPLGPDNLVAQALALVEVEAAVEIMKRIPPGAGLGGGSSDAAAILRWAGYDDLVRAGQLGADIPFCLAGGRARVSGIGDEIEALPFVESELTLLTPPFGCNTAAVYRVWDSLGGPRGDHGNDLESAAIEVEPRMIEYRDRLAELSGQRPRLAGSGSTWFVDGAYRADDTLVVRTTPAL